MSKYPECKKLEDNEEFIRNVCEFLEYAGYKGVFLEKENTLVRSQDILYDMLGIDAEKLEQERRAILEEQRELGQMVASEHE